MSMTLAPQVLMEIVTLDLLMMVEVDADEMVKEDVVDAVDEAMNAT